ncbi:hypothetical protein HZA38_06565 [Candidatus Peregrinibacteria bacterium]|nr:hypothetical protein [Candidatus Peregrinibacteria bacterium]
MPEIIQDPYQGIEPDRIWDRMFSGEVGGLEQVSPTTGKKGNFWSSVQNALEDSKISNRLRGNEIIELGPGTCTRFRDYCVEKGAREYAGVDLFTSSDSIGQVIGSTRVRIFGDDAYRFLSKKSSDTAIIAQFLFLAKEIFEGQCKRIGIEPKTIAMALSREIYRVQKHGEPFISFGTDELFLEQLKHAGFVGDDNGIFFRKD